MSLTSKQFSFASGLGNTLLRQLISVVAICFWYGVFMMLMLISVVLHLQRKANERTFAHNALLGVTSLSCFISTVYVAARLAVMYILMDNVLATGGSETLLELQLRLLTCLNVLILWVAFIPTLIIDGTIIWGTWALCRGWFREKRWAITFPCLLWLGTFSTILAYLTWLSTPSGFNLYIHPTPTIINNLLTAAVALSNSTNLSATLLFGWTLWSLRNQITHPTHAKMFMTFLIESGTVYFTIQLAYLGFLVKAPSEIVGRYFWMIFTPTYTMFSAMYPTVIMILKAQKPSYNDIIAGFRLSKTPTLKESSIADIEPGQRNPAGAHTHTICLKEVPPLEDHL